MMRSIKEKQRLSNKTALLGTNGIKIFKDILRQ